MGRAPTVEQTFVSYCGGKQGMDGKTFAKMCKDCHLIDRNFSPTDADLLFSKVVAKGQRRIDLVAFRRALELLAQKKGIAAHDVWRALAETGGPQLYGTPAEAVRFHDDKTLYSGVHKNGGPECVKGLGTSTQRAAYGFRRGQ